MIREVLRAIFKRPVTQRYPAEKSPPPENLRGKVYWSPQGCTGCALCVKDCPADAIKLITLDKSSKRFVFEYHVDRCIFCGQCTQNCRFNCLKMSNEEWELAANDRSNYVVYYGHPDDIASVVAGKTGADQPSTDENG